MLSSIKKINTIVCWTTHILLLLILRDSALSRTSQMPFLKQTVIGRYLLLIQWSVAIVIMSWLCHFHNKLLSIFSTYVTYFFLSSLLLTVDIHVKLNDNENLTCKILVNQLKLPIKYWLWIINTILQKLHL